MMFPSRARVNRGRAGTCVQWLRLLMRTIVAGVVQLVGQRLVRAVCQAIVWLRLDARVEGMDNVPARGAVLIVARHYHHLYDGCLLLARCPRQPALLVALDWLETSAGRRMMERLCSLAGWPVVLRADALRARGRSAYRQREVAVYARRALREGVALLLAGRPLIIFPEGYPNIDPAYTPKRGAEFLPFQPGYLTLARHAARRSDAPVALVPAGLAYRRRGGRWQARLRFGAPIFVTKYSDAAAIAATVETTVRTLSTW